MSVDAHGGDVYGRHVQLDFSVNTNPLGLPVQVKKALIDKLSASERYPDPFCRTLRSAIAQQEGVGKDMVLCGNGASDLIYRFCLALKPQSVLVCTPTFSDYARAGRLAGASCLEHRLLADNHFDVTDALFKDLARGVDLLFLCQPNNPTGRLIDPDRLHRLLACCEQQDTFVVVDECFLPFTQAPSVASLIQTHQHLFVLKALTKSHALAGLRLGYLLSGNQPLLQAVSAFGPHWPVSSLAQIAGPVALACQAHVERARQLVKAEAKRLLPALGNLGLDVLPTDANFMLFRSPIPLFEPLLDQGILIRPCCNFPGLDASYYRIAVKQPDQNDRLLAALASLLANPS